MAKKRSENCKSDNLSIYKSDKIKFNRFYEKMKECDAFKNRPLKKSELTEKMFSAIIPIMCKTYNIDVSDILADS